MRQSTAIVVPSRNVSGESSPKNKKFLRAETDAPWMHNLAAAASVIYWIKHFVAARDADKSFLNLIILNQIWIVITFFRLIWNQTEFQINRKAVVTIQISFDLTKFRKDLSVCSYA